MAEALFHMRDVAFAYGVKPVLTGLNLCLEAGRFHGLLGPNGCGKTTLLDLMTGGRRPSQGSVRFMGREVAQMPRRQLARALALAPQESRTHFPFTVRETVLMGRHPHMARFSPPAAQDLAVVEAVLDEMELGSMAGRRITELSGGERQRVSLARVLAQDTPVLLLDEPTASLDVNHSLAVLRGLERRVRRQGRTVVAVMHDINLAAAFCDHLVFLAQGQVVAAGPGDSVLDSQTIRRVFQVEARVAWDDYAGCRVVTWRKEEGA